MTAAAPAQRLPEPADAATEAASQAAAPAAVPAKIPLLAGMGPRQAAPYFLAGILIALAQGLGQGFITANLSQIAGDLGITTTSASWLLAAYMIPRSALPLILIKVRTQYGLRRFAEISILAFVAVAFAALWMKDFRSALVVQILSGAAAAPLSTLAFLYMLEPLSGPAKVKIGLPAVLGLILIGPNLARVVSPSLLGDGGLEGIHLAELGLALMCLAVVFTLKLQPQPREKVIQAGDFLSFGLIATGFSGITIAAVLGPIYWWNLPWIGTLLALSIAALAVAVILELRRDTPLIDFRWLASPAMLHLTMTLLLFRILLTEQSSGPPRFLQLLGQGGAQMEGLFGLVCVATLAGAVVTIVFIKPSREAALHAAALVLIATAAFMDARATSDWRADQFLFSQSMMSVAAMLFMPPAMMMGLMAAMRKGPTYLLSFIIVYIATQSLGSVVGSGLFTTFVNLRQAFHLQILAEQLTATDPQTQAVLAQLTRAFAAQSPDLAFDRLQAGAQLLQQASIQAWVLAYADAFRVIGLLALITLAALGLHLFRDFLWMRIDRRLFARAADASATPSPSSAKVAS
ncbi:efflux MFS transporter permease [Xinfangfangia pollutisoli]|uniref:MFS transporter n=1 Tax=Xinfangfangia pollutisoli TaxID=2865960 RepID=UPI001CD290F1|nr:MFS transporter [Xinfangfangia pollutisoli]